MRKCHNQEPIVLFKHRVLKPDYIYLAYYECPICSNRWFEVLRQNEDGSDKIKYYFDKTAEMQYKKWQKRINTPRYGTQTNQSFYYGTFQKHKNIWKTFRTNFNNEKELISKQKTLIEKI